MASREMIARRRANAMERLAEAKRGIQRIAPPRFKFPEDQVIVKAANPDLRHAMELENLAAILEAIINDVRRGPEPDASPDFEAADGMVKRIGGGDQDDGRDPETTNAEAVLTGDPEVLVGPGADYYGEALDGTEATSFTATGAATSAALAAEAAAAEARAGVQATQDAPETAETTSETSGAAKASPTVAERGHVTSEGVREAANGGAKYETPRRFRSERGRGKP